MKQANIAKELVESFGYEPKLTELTASDAWGMTKDAATSNFAKTAGVGAVAGKAASKILGRAIPGVGTALDWKDAYDRWLKGDRTGAVMSALAGAAYLVPGLGPAVGLGIDAANLGRDLAASDEPETTDGDTADTAAKPASGQLAQLQQLIGAKPDGMYGPETKEKLRIWQQNKGIKADGLPGPETYAAAGLAESKGMNMKKTTVAEDIATLRDRLMCIENQVDEVAIPWGSAMPAVKKMASAGFGKLGQQTSKLGKAAVGGIDDAGEVAAKTAAPSAAPIGAAVGKAKSAFGPEQIKKLSQSALKNPGLSQLEKQAIQKKGIIAWMKENPKKSAAILAAAGLGLGYGLSSLSTSTSGMAAEPAGSGGMGGRKKGSEELKQTQRMLNALTGANLTVDGIMGPKTQAAYDAWKAGTVKQAADIAEPLEKYHAAKAEIPPTPSQSPLGDIGKSAIEKAMPMAESIAELRDILKKYHAAKAEIPPTTPSQSPLGDIGKSAIEKAMPTMAESIAELRDILIDIERK